MAHLKDLIVNGASRFIGKAYGAFVGSFSGNLDGNATTSTTANIAKACSGNSATATTASKVYGIYTANGGQQGPGYFGTNSAGCLMSNQPINGHDEYKNWLYMDNYDGSDVGGATAIGISRTETRAYIMSSNADRKQWDRSAELLSSANYNSFAPTKTGGGASGTWPISISGNAASATTAAGLSGDLVFPEIGNTGASRKITWNGSTDGADIYYQTTESDQGNLVFNLRDDANCYLRIAANGAFKSYFSPSDGNFHGNVNGTADSAKVCTGNSASASSVPWSGVTGKPSTFTPASHSHSWDATTGKPAGIVKVASWDGSTLSLTTAT